MARLASTSRRRIALGLMLAASVVVSCGRPLGRYAPPESSDAAPRDGATDGQVFPDAEIPDAALEAGVDAGVDAGLPDASPGPDAGATCPGADGELIQAAFSVCADGRHVGQISPAAGVTCADVCCVLGFAGCELRAAQASFNVCQPTDPQPSGQCADVFQSSWSSQCRCQP